jgi:hypothetical protein
VCKVGRLTIPSFDGSAKCTSRACVQKLDTYLQLNPIVVPESVLKALKYSVKASESMIKVDKGFH